MKMNNQQAHICGILKKLKNKLTDTENRLVVDRGGGGGHKMGRWSQKVQAYYKINKS